MSTLRSVTAVLSSLVVAISASGALTLGQDKLGNIFFTTEAVTIPISGAIGTSVRWMAMDFFGATVGEGQLALTGGAGVIEPKLGRRGWFELRLTEMNGSTVLSRTETTFAVLTPISVSATGNSPFGAQTHFAQSTPMAVMSLIARAGIAHLRDEHYWGSIERAGTNPKYVYPANFTTFMSAAATEGIAPMLTLNWANPLYDFENGKFTPPYTATGLAGYADYANELLNHYPSQLEYVEVWNEFNGGSFVAFPRGATTPGQDYYKRMIKAVYDRVKGGGNHPDAKIVAGATVPVAHGFLRNLFEVTPETDEPGVMPFLDVVSVHPYRGFAEGVDLEISELRRLIRNYNGGVAKPIWASEFSLNVDEAAKQKAGAAYLAKMVTLMRTAGVERMYYYPMQDDEGFPYRGLVRAGGLAGGSYLPNPSYVAYANSIRQLDGWTAAGRVAGTANSTYVHKFTKSGSPILHVLWANSPTTVYLGTTASVTVIDLMGHETTLAPTGGQVALSVDSNALYVRGNLSSLTEAANPVVADSVDGYSKVQGANGWYYGYADLPSAATTYSPAAFQPMTWKIWQGDNYRWLGSDIYPFIQQGNAHPSSSWAIRRWISTVSGPQRLTGRIARGGDGDGVGFRIFVDGAEEYRYYLNPNESHDYDLTVLGVKVGSTIDFAITQGGNSTGDSTSFTVRITDLASWPEPPPAPYDLRAASGELQVTLTWTGSTFADWYNVKRATVSGGPYTTIAAPTTASSTDMDAQDGVTYYYVISGENQWGEGADSHEVQVDGQLGSRASASKEKPPSETADAAFDGVATTKWFTGGGPSSGWLQYYFGARGTIRRTVIAYELTSGSDLRVRDPRDWQFQGSNDGTSWTTLDTRTGEEFLSRHQTNHYPISNTTAYAYYRLNILRTHGGSTDGVQLAEMSFTYAPDTVPAPPISLTATAVSPDQIDLEWTGSFNATGYHVMRSQVSGGPYTTVASSVSGAAFSDTGLSAATTYYYVVTAANGSGQSAPSNEAVATTRVAVPPDTTAPTVALSVPFDGAIVAGSMTVSAEAWDAAAGSGLAGVQFRLDGADFGAEDTTAPYSITSDITAIPDGNHVLTAVARDAAGNTATSASVTVTVANAGPITLDNADATGVAISSGWTAATSTPGFYGADFLWSLAGSRSVSFTPTIPRTGSYRVYLRWTAHENRATNAPVAVRHGGGVANFSVNMTTNGGTWVALGAFTFAAGTTGNVTVRADGADGYVVADAVQFVYEGPGSPIDTTPPTIALSAPLAGATVGGLVTVAADAADNAGGTGLAGVQFLVDGSPVGAEDTTAPYSVAWDTTVVPDGQHVLTAVARDAAGNTATAANVTVTSYGTPITLDNADATGVAISSGWTAGTSTPGYYGADFLWSLAASRSVSFTPTIPRTGSYRVYLRWAAHANRATNAPVEVRHGGGVANFSVNMRTNGGAWVALGAFTFAAGTTGNVTVRADGANGYVVADAVQFVYEGPGSPIDTTPPTIALSAPLAGATVGGLVTLAADAAANSGGTGVAGVQFLVDGAPLGTEDTTAPYSVVWDTTVVPDGQHVLTAVARDAAGNTATSASVTVTSYGTPITLDNAGATGVAISSGWTAGTSTPGYYGADFLWSLAGSRSVSFTPTIPRTGSYRVYLRWTAHENRASNALVNVRHGGGTDAVAVDMRTNGGTWITLGAFSFAAGATGNVTVRADGADGYVVADAVQFIYEGPGSSVDTTPPTIALSAPLAGATVGGLVTVAADAADNAGGTGLAGVQFLLDGAPLGAEDTTAPYSVDWDTTVVPDGQHVLTAVARDAAGNTTTSASVTVTSCGTPITLDNADATGVAISPGWTAATSTPGYYGADFLWSLAGSRSVTFTPTIPRTGSYRVYLRWAAHANRATNAPVEVRHGGGVANFSVNMTTNGGTWVALGAFTFAAGTTGNLTVRADGADGYVIADAVQFVYEGVGASAPDTTPPTIALSAPLAGATVGGMVTVAADTVDNAGGTGLAGVQFLLDGAPLGAEDTTAPYSVDWDTTVATDGQHVLTAIARDAAGNTATAANVTVTSYGTPITLDNAGATGVAISPGWTAATSTSGFYGTNYLWSLAGSRSVSFTPTIPQTGSYRVYLRWASNANRATNAAVDVRHESGTANFSVNMSTNGGTWVALGTFTFAAGTTGNVTVRADGANGYVIADAVQFVRQ